MTLPALRSLFCGSCAILTCASSSGCFLSPLPDMRTPADHARQIAPKCSGSPEGASATWLSPSAVEAVQPAYSHVSSGPSTNEARLRGARLYFGPQPGLSRESLQRALECHQSRVLLGTAPEVADDPYFLRGAWLDIDADSTGDGFVVAVQAETFADARRVLERARKFTGR
jgi:hypothetical protein